MTAPREQLATALTQARIDAGYRSHNALARAILKSRSVVSKAESAGQPTPADDVIVKWAEVTHADATALLELANRARDRRSWFVEWSSDFEARATLIRWFEPLLIPGLLQTPDYARAALSWKPESASVDDNLRDRMDRQSVLDRCELRVVLLSSALERQVGERAVMTEQLDHLVNLGERPTITIQVLPDTPEVAGGIGGAFAVASEGSADVAAFVGSVVRGSVFTDAPYVARAVRLFDALRADALPWRQTIDELKRIGERWATTGLHGVRPSVVAHRVIAWR